MAGGWIKLYRQLLDWEWYTTPNMVHLYVHIVMTANHSDKEVRGILVKRGQLLTGRSKLSAETGISAQSVRTCLQRLQSTSNLTIKSTNKFSLITVCNYDKFQEDQSSANQQINQPTHQQLTTNKKLRREEKENIGPLAPSDCPHLKIVGAYNSILGDKLPRVKPKLWNGVRKKHLQARWKEDKDRQNLAWWKKYFTRVRSSDFLCGGNGKAWTADMGWLINANNMVKVLEGKYKNKHERSMWE